MEPRTPYKNTSPYSGKPARRAPHTEARVRIWDTAAKKVRCCAVELRCMDYVFVLLSISLSSSA
jgi:hypothetical protein